jgi:hypothetical protein
MPIQDKNGNNITAVNVVVGGVTTSITTVNVVRAGVSTTVFSTATPPPATPPPATPPPATPPPATPPPATPPPATPPPCPEAGTVLRTFTNEFGAECIAFADGNCGETILCEF